MQKLTIKRVFLSTLPWFVTSKLIKLDSCISSKPLKKLGLKILWRNKHERCKKMETLYTQIRFLKNLLRIRLNILCVITWIEISFYVIFSSVPLKILFLNFLTFCNLPLLNTSFMSYKRYCFGSISIHCWSLTIGFLIGTFNYLSCITNGHS